MTGNQEVLTITGPFPEYCTRSMNEKFGGHRGIDFAAKPGDAFRSLVAGQVLWVRSGTRGGKSSRVIISPLNKPYSLLYVHCLPHVKAGDFVNPWDILGECDMSGHTTGGHLHYEANDLNGDPIEPLQTIVEPAPQIRFRLLPGEWDGRSIEWVLKNKNPAGWRAIKDKIV